MRSVRQFALVGLLAVVLTGILASDSQAQRRRWRSMSNYYFPSWTSYGYSYPVSSYYGRTYYSPYSSSYYWPSYYSSYYPTYYGSSSYYPMYSGGYYSPGYYSGYYGSGVTVGPVTVTWR